MTLTAPKVFLTSRIVTWAIVPPTCSSSLVLQESELSERRAQVHCVGPGKTPRTNMAAQPTAVFAKPVPQPGSSPQGRFTVVSRDPVRVPFCPTISWTLLTPPETASILVRLRKPPNCARNRRWDPKSSDRSLAISARTHRRDRLAADGVTDN